mgnify:CR=1 FL=1
MIKCFISKYGPSKSLPIITGKLVGKAIILSPATKSPTSETLVLLIFATFIAQMIDGVVPPNEDGTTVVSRQRQRRLDRMAIRREATTNLRLARQREQRQRQQQARDQLRQARAQMTPEQLKVRQQQDRDRRAEMTPDQLEFRQQQDRQHIVKFVLN